MTHRCGHASLHGIAPRYWRFCLACLAKRAAESHACRERGAAVVHKPCAARGRPRKRCAANSVRRESGPGCKHGRLVWCRYTTCTTSTAPLAPAPMGCMLALRASGRANSLRQSVDLLWQRRQRERERERERESRGQTHKTDGTREAPRRPAPLPPTPPHPNINRALRRSASEVRKDPVQSTWFALIHACLQRRERE